VTVAQGGVDYQGDAPLWHLDVGDSSALATDATGCLCHW
jgi:hypothetical protein